ncbi:hypothetical protein BBW65_06010 [Helicobacter enhydrae]|uniref:DUF306 domain-containing protein n=1 Tax=Helicobacter enhydrae TaxID=222136 RepID=A0A1B1U6L2_9HELI|nr:META domain-containing protein [Helicobacter enhydrae]ANV98376.1 hypothetical protein BBW65_06010 [Helicobacter enhydrae]
MFFLSSKILRTLLMVFVIFVFSGCFVLNVFDTGPSINLGKNQWSIASFENDSVVYTPEDYDVVPDLRFDTQELKIYGNTGCNSFSATYSWVKDEKKEKTIEIRDASLTRKLCSEEIMTFEQKLMEEFDGEFAINEDGDNMVLTKEQLTIHLTPYDNTTSPNNQDVSNQ